MFLFLKIDTSGLLRNDLPLSSDQQPWAVRIAFEHTDRDGKRINAIDVLVKADGRSIKPGALDVHGVSLRESEQLGLKEAATLHMLADAAGKSDLAISYAEFDTQVIDSLLIRLAAALKKDPETYRRRWRRPGLTFLTIQDPVAKIECALSSEVDGEEWRRPTLAEACDILLPAGAQVSGSTTWTNLERTARLFFTLRDKGHFQEVLPCSAA
ncbi:MAG: hypothetical protein JJ902_05200 [Roseibium sp.]|nr:hypothetical protein [Roseibium sp.]